MAFAWALLDAEGAETGRSETFPDPEGAEAWLGGAWEDLAASGVQEVALLDLDAGRERYRMGLGEE